MRDIGETLSIQDCYDLLEVANVDAYNRRILSKRKS